MCTLVRFTAAGRGKGLERGTDFGISRGITSSREKPCDKQRRAQPGDPSWLALLSVTGARVDRPSYPIGY